MLFFVTEYTPRLSYITSFIAKQVTKTDWIFTTDREAFSTSHLPKINYSNHRITEEELWLRPHGLLSARTIEPQQIECFNYNGQKVFFQTAGDYPFDIFAAAFYLLSRYEEYLPHAKDMYGRYDHQNSLAFKEDFLQTPMINYWLKDFAAKLQSKFPSVDLIKSAFIFLPTYDIDEAYSFKHKTIIRHMGAIAKALVKTQSPQIGKRLRVLLGKSPDPFDSFEWMDKLHERHELKPHYFFLIPAQTGKYDRNILPSVPAMQQLIKHISSKYPTGIHPSWQSGDDASLMMKEKKILEEISGRSIAMSRQHFIRFSMPETFRNLVKAGIKEEFSMGYGSINGFRASVACPFYWYDLAQEETTELLLFPFCFMEANSFFEQHLTPQQALMEMRHYLNKVKEVDGTLITLWHNTFLGTATLFKGWREVYQQFIEEATS